MRHLRVPSLGPAVPRRRGRVLRGAGRAALWLLGWRFEGQIPDVPRCVVIVAPHTSNWDFVVGLAALLALDLRVRWLGKHTIFRFPFGALWRSLGGVPVDRAAPDGVVDATARLFSAAEPVWVGVAPEGTRYKVERWKSGFWRIARAGAVPILPVALDHRQRALWFAPLYVPTDDLQADVEALRLNFNAEMAWRPDRY